MKCAICGATGTNEPTEVFVEGSDAAEDYKCTECGAEGTLVHDKYGTRTSGKFFEGKKSERR